MVLMTSFTRNIQEELKTEEMTVIVYATYSFLKQKIFSLLVGFSEFVRSQVQLIGVTKFQCGLNHTQNLQGIFLF